MKKISLLIFALIVCIGCNENRQKITSIRFNEQSKVLMLGTSEQLVVIHTPETTQAPTYTWSSDNSNIVQVDKNGRATAISVGVANIRVYADNNLTSTCAITVPDIDIQSIAFNKASTTLYIDNQETLYVTFIPETGTNKSTTWSTSDLFIVTVDEAGIINGRRAGNATITATTINGLTAKCEVTVIEKNAVSITLNKESTSIIVGQSEKLIAKIYPSFTSNKTVKWNTSDKSIAEVDDNGNITAIKKGTATITASTSNGLTATCEVTVTIIPASGITITPTKASFNLGETAIFDFALQPANATSTNVVWSSSDNKTAIVKNGICYGLKEGTANISVTTEDGTLSATANIVITDPTIYSQIGVPYVTRYGLLCTINSITVSDDGIAQLCTVNYTTKNITTDKVLSELLFVCKKASGEYGYQTGFFGDLYPNDVKTRSFTLKTLLSDPFFLLEISSSFTEVIDPTRPNLFWKVQ